MSEAFLVLLGGGALFTLVRSQHRSLSLARSSFLKVCASLLAAPGKGLVYFLQPFSVRALKLETRLRKLLVISCVRFLTGTRQNLQVVTVGVRVYQKGFRGIAQVRIAFL